MCDIKIFQTVEDASAEAPKKVEACEAGADRCCRKGKHCCKKDKKSKKCPDYECDWDNKRHSKPCGRRFRKNMMKECKDEEKLHISTEEYEEFKAWQKRHKKHSKQMKEHKKSKMLCHGRCHPYRFWRRQMWHKMMHPSMPQPMHCRPMSQHHPRHQPCDPHQMMMQMWMRKMMSEKPCHKGWGGPMRYHHHPHHHHDRECPRHERHQRMGMMGRFHAPCFGWGSKQCGPWKQWGCMPPSPQKHHGHHGHHHCHHHGNHSHWEMHPHADFRWHRGGHQWW